MLGKNTNGRKVPQTNATGSEGSDPRVSVLGTGMTVHGDCTSDGRIRVEGKIEGDLLASGLELTATGTVEGDASVPPSAAQSGVFVVGGRVTGKVTASIVEVRETGVVLGGIEADEVTVAGQVEGGLMVRRRLAVAETAVVNGEVRTQRLHMQEGGRVNGTVVVGRPAGQANHATPEPAAA